MGCAIPSCSVACPGGPLGGWQVCGPSAAAPRLRPVPGRAGGRGLGVRWPLGPLGRPWPAFSAPCVRFFRVGSLWCSVGGEFGF